MCPETDLPAPFMVMLNVSEASAFSGHFGKRRSFGGVYPELDEGPQDDVVRALRIQ
jgi:hypothetical protein